MEIYIVRPGDSLPSIARGFGLEAENIRRMNQLADPRRLTQGLSLVLDTGERSQPESAEFCAALSPRAEGALLKELMPSLSWLCVQSCALTAQGQLYLPEDGALLNLAAENSVLPLLSLTNTAQGGFSALLAHQLLSNRDTVEALVSRLPEVLEDRGYRGVELNFQYLFSFDRDSYSRFVRRLSEVLHAVGYYLFISLAPKTLSTEESPLCAAHDYEALSRCADRVILLCHDWGSCFTAPQAISPADRTAAVLDYAASIIPPGKTLLSLSSCGCCWSLPWHQGDEGKMLSCSLATNMAVSTGAEIKFDRTAQAPFFTCGIEGQRRVVWYEDSRSIRSRFYMARDSGLAGISLWPRDRLYRPGLSFLLSRCAGEKLI